MGMGNDGVVSLQDLPCDSEDFLTYLPGGSRGSRDNTKQSSMAGGGTGWKGHIRKKNHLLANFA